MIRITIAAWIRLMTAILIGSLIAAPFMVSNVRILSVLSFRIGSGPSNDADLQSWIGDQTHVCSVAIARDQSVVTVRYEANHLRQVLTISDLTNKMRSLGYSITAIEGEHISMANRIQDFISDPRVLTILIGGTQLAFAIIGGIAIHASKFRKDRSPTVRSHRYAIMLGILTGLGMLVIGELYSDATVMLRGANPRSPWEAVASLPTRSRLIVIVMGGLFAPFAEEIFFRGCILRQYMDAGYYWRGGLVCSFLFAIVHIADPWNVPCIFLLGLTLSWLYIQTGALLAPTIAHAVNNVVALVMYAQS